MLHFKKIADHSICFSCQFDISRVFVVVRSVIALHNLINNKLANKEAEKKESKKEEVKDKKGRSASC